MSRLAMNALATSSNSGLTIIPSRRSARGRVSNAICMARGMSPYRRLISGSLLFRFLRGPAQLYVLARLYFCERMMGVDERLQPFLQHMRIDLRRRNVSMSEQLLHG